MVIRRTENYRILQDIAEPSNNNGIKLPSMQEMFPERLGSRDAFREKVKLDGENRDIHVVSKPSK